jgi:hypothetical protein
MPPRRRNREETKVNDQNDRSARLRYTATGALAALAVAGAIAGTAALAAKPSATTRAHAAVANCGATKSPTAAMPGKNDSSQPPANPQLFLNAIRRLVDDGTISTTEGQVVDREILAGRVDTDTLASSGFTQTQLAAVQRALGNTKRSLAAAVPRTPK